MLAKFVVFQKGGNQLRCQPLSIMEVFHFQIDGKVAGSRPFENMGHNACLAKAPRRDEVNVVSRQQIPNALNQVFAPEQFIRLRYTPGQASDVHEE
jgi:hypothetical protein